MNKSVVHTCAADAQVSSRPVRSVQAKLTPSAHAGDAVAHDDVELFKLDPDQHQVKREKASQKIFNALVYCLKFVMSTFCKCKMSWRNFKMISTKAKPSFAGEKMRKLAVAARAAQAEAPAALLLILQHAGLGQGW